MRNIEKYNREGFGTGPDGKPISTKLEIEGQVIDFADFDTMHTEFRKIINTLSFDALIQLSQVMGSAGLPVPGIPTNLALPEKLINRGLAHEAAGN